MTCFAHRSSCIRSTDNDALRAATVSPEITTKERHEYRSRRSHQVCRADGPNTRPSRVHEGRDRLDQGSDTRAAGVARGTPRSPPPRVALLCVAQGLRPRVSSPRPQLIRAWLHSTTRGRSGSPLSSTSTVCPRVWSSTRGSFGAQWTPGRADIGRQRRSCSGSTSSGRTRGDRRPVRLDCQRCGPGRNGDRGGGASAGDGRPDLRVRRRNDPRAARRTLSP